MKISVVMATYNGSEYIVSQLESIRLQSLKVDEVLIFDDCSTDDTVKVVEEYIQKKGLSNWSMKVNRKNYGWKKNFALGLQKASGDYIFPADQDDIWASDKIETMVNVMDSNSKIKMLVANYTVIHFNEEPDLFVSRKYDNKVTYIPFGKKWYYIQRPGCVFCFRKELANYIKDLWFEDYAHDVILWHLSELMDGLYHINYSAIFFRRHNLNATPANMHDNKTRLKHEKIAVAEAEHILEWLKTIEIPNKEEKTKIIKQYLKFEKTRCRLLVSKKIKFWFDLLPNVGYYLRISSWPIDLICTFRK